MPEVDEPDVAFLRRAVEELTRGLADPAWVANVDPLVVQRLLGAAVALYAGKVDLARWLPPFDDAAEATVPTASEVCLATTQMLDAVSVEIFELALWKSWAHSAIESGGSEQGTDHGGGTVNRPPGRLRT